MLLKEIQYGYKKNLYYILIPLILLIFTSSKEVVKQAFPMIFLEGDKTVEYMVSILPSDISQIRDQLHNYLIILILIAYFVPYRSFSIEGNVMKAITLSPVNNRLIVRMKYLAAFILLILITLLYGYLTDMNISGIIIFLLGSSLFIAMGLFFGIYSENKPVNVLSFTLIFFMLIAPRLFQDNYNKLLSMLENCITDKDLWRRTIIVLLALNVLFEQLIELVWIKKNRRKIN